MRALNCGNPWSCGLAQIAQRRTSRGGGRGGRVGHQSGFCARTCLYGSRPQIALGSPESWPSRMTGRFERDESALRAREARGCPSGMVRRARFSGRPSRHPAPIENLPLRLGPSWSIGIAPCPAGRLLLAAVNLGNRRKLPGFVPGRITGLPPKFYTLQTPRWLALKATPRSRPNYGIDHRTTSVYK
jgi:hypothetical protein